jgi:hypothetical protein
MSCSSWRALSGQFVSEDPISLVILGIGAVSGKSISCAMFLRRSWKALGQLHEHEHGGQVRIKWIWGSR